MRSRDLPPAVVLGGNANAISVSRSLARKGVRVIAYGNQHSHIRHSRSCAEYVDVGRGTHIGDRWLRRLLDRRHQAVILPCDDDALEMVASHRETLVHAGYQPFEAHDQVVLAMLDKWRTYELARAAGISTPRVIALTDDAAVDRAIEEIGFPSAIKPIRSHAFARVYGGRKAFRVESPRDLRRLVAETRLHRLAMVLVEIVPGSDDRLCSYYAYIDGDGRTLVGLTKRKIRQYPNGFGLGSFEITDVSPDVASAGSRFFAAAGIRGLANVEFKRDARDGTLRLIECNHRFTASNELIQVAGIDLAWLSYARLVDAPLPPLDRYRSGVTLWNPIRDLRGLANSTARGDARVTDWLPGLMRRHVLPVFRWDDPLPTIAHHASRLAAVPVKLGFDTTAGRATAQL